MRSRMNLKFSALFGEYEHYFEPVISLNPDMPQFNASAIPVIYPTATPPSTPAAPASAAPHFNSSHSRQGER